MGRKLSTWDPNVLRYSPKEPDRKKVRRHYKMWRKEHDIPVERCDMQECRFYSEPLIWNGKRLELVLNTAAIDIQRAYLL
jgi:hypothetical protein